MMRGFGVFGAGDAAIEWFTQHLKVSPLSDGARSGKPLGPEAPAGQEANWVPTVAGKGFFLVFRFYGPTESFMDKTWVLNDLDLVV